MIGNKSLFILSFALSLVGCGTGSIDVRSGSANGGDNEDEFALATEKDAFCPAGSSYLSSHHLCVSTTEAIGPFTPAMIATCKKWGGGEDACSGDRWSLAFAKSIRGTAACPPGSTLDAALSACVNGGDAFGPFSKAVVDNCKKLGGGLACESMRIAKGFVKIEPAPNDTGYRGSRPYLKLSFTGALAYAGLKQLRLELHDTQGRELDSVAAVSGQPYAQVFRKASESRTGSMEPLPEGLWTIRYPSEGLNGVEFAGAIDDYTTVFNAGLGPTFAEIVMQKGFVTERQAIGIHVDGNRSTSPGTAGCVGISTMAELKRFVNWFRDGSKAPRTVVVDWRLGTLPGTFSLDSPALPLSLVEAYLPVWERVKRVEQEP